ncbi:uncharacterized protein LOC144619248 [Crassostrea virginica]
MSQRRIIPVGAGICTSCRKKLSVDVTDDYKAAVIQDIESFKDIVNRNLNKAAELYCYQTANTFGESTNDPDSQSLISSQSSEPLLSQNHHSDWEEENKTPLEKFNAAMKILDRNFPCLNSQLNLPWRCISKSSNSYYMKIIMKSIHLILDYITPVQTESVKKDICRKMLSEAEEDEDNVDEMTESLIASYLKQDNRVVQIQILSLFADKFTKEKLLELIPGITIFKIDAARRHAALTYPGQVISPPTIIRPRLSMPKVLHFLEFISCPSYHQAVGYGSKTLTLSSGAEIKIPKVVRNILASRLVNSYMQYCREESEYQCLSRATLFKILKVCVASQKRNMHGLNNITSEGMKAVDVLQRLISKLQVFGLSHEVSACLESLLAHVNQHLKFEMKSHIESKSLCADHCSIYSLSDPKCDEFRSACSHKHEQYCDECSATCKLDTALIEAFESPTSQPGKPIV